MSRLTSRANRSKTPAILPRLQVGAVSLPMPGETLNGDAWAIDSGLGTMTNLMVVDAFGGGPVFTVTVAYWAKPYGKPGDGASVTNTPSGPDWWKTTADPDRVPRPPSGT